ncbi:DUF7736 domain-containing protein [Catelliglobosispora koreensis]|uniref:DUF7736 domain-containing protein n=1 Tax=Catelliglobosispora koreensis TaxID=129052 RepID=UPI00035D69CA|nr:hypothetical protein [Catelliglobosispora koreensis]
MTKTFSLGAVLTVTTDIMLCPFDDLHELIEFMAGEPVWIHQLTRVANEAKPELLRQHPDLADVTVPELSSWAECAAFLATLAAVYGTEREVSPLSREDHTSVDPLAEFAMNFPGVEVVPVVLDGEVAP